MAIMQRPRPAPAAAAAAAPTAVAVAPPLSTLPKGSAPQDLSNDFTELSNEFPDADQAQSSGDAAASQAAAASASNLPAPEDSLLCSADAWGLPAAAPVSEPAAASAPALVPQVAAAAPQHPPAAQAAPVVAPPKKRAVSALTAQERREANMLAELYSILVTTEHLETAFVRGAVSNEDYERNCTQILAQFKTLQNGLRDRCPDVRTFIREQGIHCPLAEERLLDAGVAATALYQSGTAAAGGAGKESLACFKASEGFITLSDALKLDLRAVDELLPLVRDLQASILSIPNLPPLAGLERIAGWLVTLNGKRASDRLDDSQCRQLAMDVELAYTSLKGWLQEKS